MAAFLHALRPPPKGRRGDIVLVSSLGRLAPTRRELASVMAQIHAKGALIFECREPPRRSDRAADLREMMFDAVDELSQDRRTHSPEAARKYGAKGGQRHKANREAVRAPAAGALGPWRDLSLTAEQALGTPAMYGWTIRMAYRLLGKRNTAPGTRHGRPRASAT